MPNIAAACRTLLVILVVATLAPLTARAATTSPASVVVLPWVPNGEVVGGLGPWYGELSFQNLGASSCALSVYVSRNGSWVRTAQISLTAGAARTIGASTLAIPSPGSAVRLVAGCPLAASVKQITPDVVTSPWSDGAEVVTGYAGIAQADIDAATAGEHTAWFLPIAQTNSDWNTYVRITNFADTGVDVVAEFYPTDNIVGSEGADLVLTRRIGIGQTWSLNTLFELGESGWVGYARISVSDDAAVIALRTKASTSMALTNVGIAADASAIDQQYISAAPLLFNAYNGWNTGINLANVSDEVAEVRLEYYEAGGGMVQEDTLYLLPRSMQYIYTPGDVPDAGFVGSARIISDMPVVAAIDEVKYETTEGLSYHASAIGQRDAAIPLAFREDPTKNRHDNSGINVSNLNQAAEQVVTITLVDVTGAHILDEPVTLTLPPGGSNFVYLPFIEGVPHGTLAAVRMTSNDSAGFVAISNDINYVVGGDGSVVFPASSSDGYYRIYGTPFP